jgi:hypothetical protein
LWNSLPIDAKCEPSIMCFKKKVIRFLHDQRISIENDIYLHY